MLGPSAASASAGDGPSSAGAEGPPTDGLMAIPAPAAPAEDETPMCPVCRCEMVDGDPNDEVVRLICNHRLHKYCWQGVCDNRRRDENGELEELRCPECRSTEATLLELEAALFEASAPPKQALVGPRRDGDGSYFA